MPAKNGGRPQATGASPQARLVALKPWISPDRFILTGASISIGRSNKPRPELAIRVKGIMTVSREHAIVRYTEDQYILYDTSGNGTFVNGRQISGPYILKHDDVIGLGIPEPHLRFETFAD